jgi:predicted metal-binding membrane protein
MVNHHMSTHRTFISVSALLFAASAVVTIVWCGSMSTMGGMEMPGGWTMSMTWMRMPGQSWPGAAASFLGMWIVMMVAMMLPSLVPMLSRYRQAVRGRDSDGFGDSSNSPATGRTPGSRSNGGASRSRLGWLTALVGVAYFFVWTVLGIATFPIGMTLAAIEMQHPSLSRAVPLAAGVVILLAGALQFTAWKARQLSRCRETPARAHTLPADARTAWRHGLRLGLHCSYSCAGPMAVLLVLGLMDLRAMAAVTAAITLERLAPNGTRMARAIGAIAIAAGLLSIARAISLG